MAMKSLLVFAVAFVFPFTVHAQLGPSTQANPWVGTHGAAGMHGDTLSSDTTPLTGPGSESLESSFSLKAAACPTMLIRKDGKPMVLCTAWLGRKPTVHLLDKNNSRTLASLSLPAGSLLGGVYAFLDNKDRLVMVDGEQNLVRIEASTYKKGFRLITWWQLEVVEQVSLRGAVTGHCGGGDCDAVVSISPDGWGDVWFVTLHGLVGIYHPQTGTLDTLILTSGETIHNSFSTTNDGRAAMATDHALYLLQKDASGSPFVAWRYEYDRGFARKPGQLSYGTGATPTFFGPADGTEFVTITDNADGQMSLLVFDASPVALSEGNSSGELICQHPLFDENASGTENSAIGIGLSVFVASTYGYPYPALPEGAGESMPKSADFIGGMVRVDIRPDWSGCDLIWENDVRSAAVPKLSVSDELIYTTERRGSGDSYHFTAVDPYTGDVLAQKSVGGTMLHDTLQMAGNIGHEGVYWQGTAGGIIRISQR